jgi:hypothetical protein
MSSDDLITKRDAVCDEASFVAFLSAFVDERADEVQKKGRSSGVGAGARRPENKTIEAFFEAACAWAEASQDGLESYQKPQNPWRRCADILYCGKTHK